MDPENMQAWQEDGAQRVNLFHQVSHRSSEYLSDPTAVIRQDPKPSKIEPFPT